MIGINLNAWEQLKTDEQKLSYLLYQYKRDDSLEERVDDFFTEKLREIIISINYVKKDNPHFNTLRERLIFLHSNLTIRTEDDFILQDSIDDIKLLFEKYSRYQRIEEIELPTALKSDNLTERIIEISNAYIHDNNYQRAFEVLQMAPQNSLELTRQYLHLMHLEHEQHNWAGVQKILGFIRCTESLPQKSIELLEEFKRFILNVNLDLSLQKEDVENLIEEFQAYQGQLNIDQDLIEIIELCINRQLYQTALMAGKLISNENTRTNQLLIIIENCLETPIAKDILEFAYTDLQQRAVYNINVLNQLHNIIYFYAQRENWSEINNILAYIREKNLDLESVIIRKPKDIKNTIDILCQMPMVIPENIVMLLAEIESLYSDEDAEECGECLRPLSERIDELVTENDIRRNLQLQIAHHCVSSRLALQIAENIFEQISSLRDIDSSALSDLFAIDSLFVQSANFQDVFNRIHSFIRERQNLPQRDFESIRGTIDTFNILSENYVLNGMDIDYLLTELLRIRNSSQAGESDSPTAVVLNVDNDLYQIVNISLKKELIENAIRAANEISDDNLRTDTLLKIAGECIETDAAQNILEFVYSDLNQREINIDILNQLHIVIDLYARRNEWDRVLEVQKHIIDIHDLTNDGIPHRSEENILRSINILSQMPILDLDIVKFFLEETKRYEINENIQANLFELFKHLKTKRLFEFPVRMDLLLDIATLFNFDEAETLLRDIFQILSSYKGDVAIILLQLNRLSAIYLENEQWNEVILIINTKAQILDNLHLPQLKIIRETLSLIPDDINIPNSIVKNIILRLHLILHPEESAEDISSSISGPLSIIDDHVEQQLVIEINKEFIELANLSLSRGWEDLTSEALKHISKSSPPDALDNDLLRTAKVCLIRNWQDQAFLAFKFINNADLLCEVSRQIEDPKNIDVPLKALQLKVVQNSEDPDYYLKYTREIIDILASKKQKVDSFIERVYTFLTEFAKDKKYLEFVEEWKLSIESLKKTGLEKQVDKFVELARSIIFLQEFHDSDLSARQKFDFIILTAQNMMRNHENGSPRPKKALASKVTELLSRSRAFTELEEDDEQESMRQELQDTYNSFRLIPC